MSNGGPAKGWRSWICGYLWGEEPAQGADDDSMNRCERGFVAVYIALVALLLLYLFGKFWPADLATAAWKTQPTEELFFGLITVKTSVELRLLVLVLCAGALGAMLHAVQSFVDFHGNQQLKRSWLPWYLLRPFIGALLALILYLLIQGGLVAEVTKSGDAVKLYTLAGVAALMGMFSELATIKLKDVFTTLVAAPVKPRSDPLLPAAKPEITALQPAQLALNAASLQIKILGKNFDKAAKVRAGGQERKVSNITPTELTVELLPADVATQGVLKIVVDNPTGSGGASDPKDLKVG
jgi:hypothetical protein